MDITDQQQTSPPKGGGKGTAADEQVSSGLGNGTAFVDPSKTNGSGGRPSKDDQNETRSERSGSPLGIASAKRTIPAKTRQKNPKYKLCPYDVLDTGKFSKMLTAAIGWLKRKVRYNSFTNRLELHRTDLPGHPEIDPNPEPIMNKAIDKLSSDINCQVNLVELDDNDKVTKNKPFDLPQQKFKSALNAVALENAYDPPKIWLEKIESLSLTPFPQPLSDVFEVKTDWLHSDPYKTKRYTDEVFLALMRGLVWRIMHPGCQHDTVTLLCGPQGIGKSKFFRYLLPNPEWFAEGLSLRNPDKHTVEQIQGKLLYEVPELALGKADNSNCKNFITRRVDTCDFKYQNTDDYKRRCIFVATTNDAQSLPNDPSGNRRFHPVRVDKRDDVSTTQLVQHLKDNRLKYFAFAKYQVTVLKMTSELPEDCLEMQARASDESRTQSDVMTEEMNETFEKFLGKHTEVPNCWDYFSLKVKDLPNLEDIFNDDCKFYYETFIKFFKAENSNRPPANQVATEVFQRAGFKQGRDSDKLRKRFWKRG